MRRLSVLQQHLLWPAPVEVGPCKSDDVQFTAEEVEKRVKDGAQWVIIDGKVVDVASFAAKHPGGAGILRAYVGKDATAAYRKVPHSPDADEIVASLAVGRVDRAGEVGTLDQALTVGDVMALGRKAMTATARTYYDAGAEEGDSLVESVRAWDDWLIRPKVLVDVSEVTTQSRVLGKVLRVPIIAAPTALLRMGHPEGECAVAKGMHMAGAGNCLSTSSSMTIEEVAKASPECYRWFQLYPYRNRDTTRQLIQRAEKAGYSAICVTVDVPVLGNRTTLQRIGFKAPPGVKVANVVDDSKEQMSRDRKAYVAKLFDRSLTTDLVEWIATLTSLPIILKGVLRGDSIAAALLCPAVKGVVVSNHGGRQLDGAIASCTALPDVAASVRSANRRRAAEGMTQVQVFVDGGIRRGRDIFKAVALGADAVLIGRPIIFGMGAGGADGVRKVVDILREELVTCMQLAGTPTLHDIDSSFVVRRGGTSRDMGN